MVTGRPISLGLPVHARAHDASVETPPIRVHTHYVIGVDTHKNAHSAAVVNAGGGVVAGVEVTASDAGYRSLLRTAQVHAAGRRAWAVEGTGSFGSGLAAFLQQHGERVLEIERPRRPRQKPAKSDQLDAIRAAREALADDKLAQPRQRGSREALRILPQLEKWRTNHHAESQHYMFRRRAEGKSDREIRRCLKRHLARRVFKILQRVDSL